MPSSDSTAYNDPLVYRAADAGGSSPTLDRGQKGFTMNRILFSTPYYSFEEDSHGQGLIRGGDEVVVVPLAEDRVVLLAVEPSTAFGEPTLILPGGETTAGESHPETANRELQEEIGYRAAKLDYLGEVRPWSKYLKVRTFLYLGRELSASKKEGDEAYAIHVERVRLANFTSLIAEGRLLDARVITALYLARDFLNRDNT